MTDKPLCPYCGAHNGHPDGVEMEDFYGYMGINGHMRAFCCPECGSVSPPDSSYSKAIEKACGRYHPIQKPMALKEFLQDVIAPFPVWLEKKEDGSIEPIIARYFRLSGQSGFVVMDGFCGDIDKYEIEWRVWHTIIRPTIEERLAAKWENGDSHE